MNPTAADRDAYAAFAARLTAGGLVADAWIDGQPRFAPAPLLLPRSQHRALQDCAEAVAAAHHELCQIVAAAPDLLDSFFALTPMQKLMWGLSAPAWHGVARADVFDTADGLRCCELNSDTPSGHADAIALGDSAGVSAGHTADLPPDLASDPNRALEARYVAMIGAFAQPIIGARPPTVGIVYPTELTEDLGLVTLLRRWLEARGATVVLGAPFNLRATSDGGVALLGAPCDVIVRHYKTDWWGERQPVWADEEPPPDPDPLLQPLRAVGRALLNRRVAVVNPFGAVLTQNKRALAFLWEERARFSAPAQAAIARFIPPTVRLEAIDRTRLLDDQDGWVLKSDYGCEGDEVVIGADVSADVWKQAVTLALPRRWVAQRRFEPRRDGDGMATNFGVYLIAGRAAGLYCRRSRGATDRTAVSVAARLVDEVAS